MTRVSGTAALTAAAICLDGFTESQLSLPLALVGGIKKTASTGRHEHRFRSWYLSGEDVRGGERSGGDKYLLTCFSVLFLFFFAFC